MKWENVAYGFTIFTALLFLEPYLDKMGISYWLKFLYIIIVVLCINFTLSKIKFLQKSVTKKVGWSTLITVMIFVAVLVNLIN
ncbi:hypothetical protein SC499_22960 [Peribacillus simplex]|uniref:hypothetical protein n=1 Tax=Peribacillus simplex TaxID=1478 RepID=UPI00298DB534|nr:hypothetical protein [Peribacillus simplex]MDW7617461.1 hypothetical protein [Peribacillus simplex]